MPAIAGHTVQASWRWALVVSFAAAAVFRVATIVVALWAAYGRNALHQLATLGVTAITAPWQKWDATWFTRIAADGYKALSPIHTVGGVYDAIVWPPLFPAMIAGIARPLGLDDGLVALVLDTIFLFAAALGVYRVVQVQYGDRLALTTILLVLAYPSSFFLGAGYTEALLLALGAWSFWAAFTGRWWLAGILVALAVLTKFYALALVPALAVEYMDQRRWSWRAIRADAVWLVAPWIAALAGWLVYVQLLVGDWSRVLTSQKYWGRHLSPPWVSILNAAGDVSTFRFIAVVDLGALAVLTALTIYTALYGRRSYAILLFFSIVVFVSSATLVSTARLAIPVFPMFIAAALVLQARPWLRYAAVLVSGPLVPIMLARFVTDRWAG